MNELPGDKNAWKYFFAVTQIPRGSNQEGEFFRHKKVLAFLKEAADELGHETYIDTADNLIVRVKATEGMFCVRRSISRSRGQAHRLLPVPYGYGLPEDR